MLSIFLISLLWIISLAGWGFTLAIVGRLEIKDYSEKIFIYILLGHVPVIVLGYLAHLFLPLGSWVAAIVCLGGCGIWLAASFKASTHAGSWKNWLLLATITGFVSLFASRQFVHGDSAYYALPAIAWTVDQSIVRGLANLDPTLGYNSSWWIVAALMSWPFGIELGVVAVSVPLLSAFGGLLVQAANRVFIGEGQWADFFLLPSSYLWIRQIVGHNTPSPAADIPANLCAILAFWAVIKALQTTFTKAESPRSSSTNPQSIARDGLVKFLQLGSSPEGALFFSFAVIAASAKISCLLLVAVAVAWLGASLLWKRSRMEGRWVLYGILAATMAAYALHGFFLSGYPFFPTEIGSFLNVPWKVSPEIPAETVARAKGWALTFGATQEEIATTPAWQLWLEKQGALVNLITFGSAALLATVGIVVLAWSKRRTVIFSAIPFVLPTLIVSFLLCWNLFHAPALRFAAGYAFCLLGILCAFLGTHLAVGLRRMVLATWIILSVLSQSNLIRERSYALLSPIPLPESRFSERKTTQGETVFIPTDGFAWLGPRPSVPEFEFKARLVFLRHSATGTIFEMRVQTPHAGVPTR